MLLTKIRQAFPYKTTQKIGVIMEVHEYENAYYQVKDDVLESLPCDEE